MCQVCGRWLSAVAASSGEQQRPFLAGRTLTEAAMKQRTMSISQIRTVAIPATDQERSLAFYTDVLGFEKTLDAPFGPGQRWIEVSPARWRNDARDPAARRGRRRASTPASDRDQRRRGGPRGAEGRRRGRRRRDPALPGRPADVHVPRPGREPPLRRRADVTPGAAACRCHGGLASPLITPSAGTSLWAIRLWRSQLEAVQGGPIAISASR